MQTLIIVGDFTICLLSNAMHVDIPSSDSVLEYAKEVFSMGLLYFEFHDAIKEGDGDRLLRCWKYLFVIFKASQRTNYSIEAFNLLCQVHYYLSPQMVHQLKYSRFINVHGCTGYNIPCDLYMEHLNRTIKDTLQHLGANKTEHAIVRSRKCSYALSTMLSNFDQRSGVKEQFGSHTRASENIDISKAVAILQANKVFLDEGQRQHSAFKSFKCNGLLSSLKLDKLKAWMEEHFQHKTVNI